MVYIGEKYRVKADGLDFTAEISAGTYKDKKTGATKTRWRAIGYYSNFRNAVNGICEYEYKRRLNESDYDLKGAVEELDRLKAEIEKYLGVLDTEMCV